MIDGCYRAEGDELITALHELDAAKASLRKRQRELDHAVRALARGGRSPDCLRTFAAVTRSMNEAVQYHRHAVEAVNALCQKQALAAMSRLV